MRIKNKEFLDNMFLDLNRAIYGNFFNQDEVDYLTYDCDNSCGGYKIVVCKGGTEQVIDLNRIIPLDIMTRRISLNYFKLVVNALILGIELGKAISKD